RGSASRRGRRRRILAGRRGTGPGPERDLARALGHPAPARRPRQGDRPGRTHRDRRTNVPSLPSAASGGGEEGGATRRKPMIPAVVIVALAILFFYSAIRILREYERGVVLTLGRYTGTKGPGLILLVPFVQQMVRVDLRVVVDEVPPQDVISRDNVTVKVNAVIYFRVVDAYRALIQVSN